MAIPILSKRSARKEAARKAELDALVAKAISPSIAMAMSATSGPRSPQVASGATYNPNTSSSSPFNQIGPGQGYVPLPRPPGNFDSGFGPSSPLFPDAIDPLGPNGRTMPRRAQYLIAANLQIIDRRLPWSVLKGLAEDVDIVARCIQLVQDAIVGLDWSWGFSPSILNQIMTEQGMTNSAKANEFARDKYGDELQRVTEFFEYPDKRMGFTFSQWLTDILYSHLVYDGIVISPQYNLGGELISLSAIDTPTIKILLDNQGFIPQPPAPAYQQILYGFPRGEYQAEDVGQDGAIPNAYEQDQLAYYIRRPHPSSVYGYSQVEECVNIATIYMQRQAWMHAEYQHGMTPKLMIETAGAETWTPEQLGYYERIVNDQLSGQTQRRQQAMLLRPGMTATQMKAVDELYSGTYDEYMILQIGAKFGIPQSQLGIQMRSSIGGGQAKGQTDQTQMFATDALKNFLIDCINDMARRFMGVGPELTMTATGGGTEDDNVQRAQADASDVGAGIRTRNEIRAERGVPLIDEPEADQLGVTSTAGVTFLSGLLTTQEATQAAATTAAANGQVLGQPKEVPSDGSGTDGASDDGHKPGDGGVGSDQGSSPKPGGSGSTGGSAGTQSGGTNSKSDSQPAVAPKDDTRQPDSDAEKELRAFTAFAKARIDRGSWRDFEFANVSADRARALNNAGAEGDLALVRALAKRDDTPSKAEDTERLNAYWAEGEGAAKIDWGVDGDWARCMVEVGKYIDDPKEAAGHCANLHHRATGAWPGHAPGESESGHTKKASARGERATLTLWDDLHDKIVAYYAPKIADALSDPDGMKTAIAAAAKKWPKKDDASKAAGDNAAASSSSDPEGIASAAVAGNVSFNTEALQQVLQDLYGDAGLAGAGTAAQALGTTEGSDFAAVIADINWNTWKPGDLESARLVANGGLREVLDAANVTIKDMTDSAIDRLGTTLANGLNEGLGPQAIADQMGDVVVDPARAMVIARTETGRAQVASSLDSYKANDTEEVDWHSNDGACPACVALDAGSPYPIDDVPAFPHHPNDRCQVLPHIDLES